MNIEGVTHGRFEEPRICTICGHATSNGYWVQCAMMMESLCRECYAICRYRFEQIPSNDEIQELSRGAYYEDGVYIGLSKDTYEKIIDGYQRCYGYAVAMEQQYLKKNAEYTQLERRLDQFGRKLAAVSSDHDKRYDAAVQKITQISVQSELALHTYEGALRMLLFTCEKSWFGVWKYDVHWDVVRDILNRFAKKLSSLTKEERP